MKLFCTILLISLFLIFGNSPTSSNIRIENNQNEYNYQIQSDNYHKNIKYLEPPKKQTNITQNNGLVCVRVDANIIREELTVQAINNGYNGEMLEKLYFIASKESSLNNCAKNPTSTAFGIFQFLDQTWKGYGCAKTTDYKEQIRCGLRYIQIRYKGIDNAYNFWVKNKWY